MEPEARLNGDKARAKREKIRSIGHGSVIEDYIFEWADKSHLRNQKNKDTNRRTCDRAGTPSVFILVWMREWIVVKSDFGGYYNEKEL